MVRIPSTLSLLPVVAFLLLSSACGGGGWQDIHLLSLLTPDDQCVSDPDAMTVSRGFLDVGATNAFYQAAVLATNDADSEKASKKNFAVEKAVLTFSADDQALSATLEALGEVEVPMALTLEAGQRAGIWIELIPPWVAVVIGDSDSLSDPINRALLTVTTHLEGTTASGKADVSSPLGFPVEVCKHCLFCPGGLEPVLWGCSPGAMPASCQ